MRVAALQKPVFGPIPGGFRASKRFLAQSSAGFGRQISFWPNPWRVSGSETVFGAILGGFWASNRFLAQSSAGFGLQISFWCNPRRVSRRPCRGVLHTPPRRPGRDGHQTHSFGPVGGRLMGRMIHGPGTCGANAIRPYTGTWSLLGVEASGLLSCLSVVRWLDKQFNISTSQHLNI